MKKFMLIDASDPAETRVVVTKDDRVEEFDREIGSHAQVKGNIYLAKVTRVEPSLQAAFVDYGGNRHGFLPFSEIHPDYYRIPIADREALLAEEAAIKAAVEEEEEEEVDAAADEPDEDEDEDDDLDDEEGDDEEGLEADAEDEDAEDDEDDDLEEDAEAPRRARTLEASAPESEGEETPDGEEEGSDRSQPMTAKSGDSLSETPEEAAAAKPSDESEQAAAPDRTEAEAAPADAPAGAEEEAPPAATLQPDTPAEALAEAPEAQAALEPAAPEAQIPEAAPADQAAGDARDGDIAPEATGPEETASEETAPGETTPEETAPQEAVLAEAAPETDGDTQSAETQDAVAAGDETSEGEAEATESEAQPASGSGRSSSRRRRSRSRSRSSRSSKSGAKSEGEAAAESKAEASAPANGSTEVVEIDQETQVDTLDGDDIEDAARRRAKLLRRYKIQEVIKRGQIMLVQVTKEERGNKGAALTTYLSLPGRYCVLMPNTARGGGISRKIGSSSDRKRLKQVLGELGIPDGMAVIVRTAGSERSKTEIRRDYDYLIRMWNEIRESTLQAQAPALIYEEGNIIKRAIRDLYTSDMQEILVEGEEGYKAAKAFMRNLMPSHARKVQLYKEQAQPLLQSYRVEAQLAGMFLPEVQLRSGGYLVINVTEALVAIDVNSGKATRERHIEETALKTNLEAADEIARQLRLRDLAGLIVIDFIDMEENRHNREVERRLKEAMKSDRARIQLGRISPFGLLELSRQRLRPSLVETAMITCPHCGGTGRLYSPETAAMTLLRAIAEEGSRREGGEMVVTVPTAVALYLLNHKRTQLAREEERFGFVLKIEIDDSLSGLQHRIDRIGGSRRTAPRPEQRTEQRSEQRTDQRPEQRGRDEQEARREQQRVPEPLEEEDDEEAEEADGQEERKEASDQESGSQSSQKRRRRRGKRGGRRRSRRDDENQQDAQGDEQEDELGDDEGDEQADEAGEDLSEDEEDTAPAEAAEAEAAERQTPAFAASPAPQETADEAPAPEAPLPEAPTRTEAAAPESAPESAEAAASPHAGEARNGSATPPATVEEDAAAASSEEQEDEEQEGDEAPAAPAPNFDVVTAPDPDRPKRRGWWNRLVR